MVSLTPNEARLLGVLIEKALTTPENYPLSLNAATNGANQKNNRDPVFALGEDDCFEALEGLRGKSLVVRVDTPGSRVHKYRHNVSDTLHVRTGELAILGELLLRGPATLGELRGRASRMHPLESLDETKNMLTALMTREEPLAKELPPAPGSRAERYVQLLCADSHAVEVSAAPAISAAPPVPGAPSMADRVTALESQVLTLTNAVRQLAKALGEPDPIAGDEGPTP